MLVEFIIPTFNRISPLQSMLASLVAQTSLNWLATVIVDDIESVWVPYFITDFNEDKIRVQFTGQRYNDWGHTPREIGKQASKADYIIMTGDDNYYVPTFVEELEKATIENPGIIYWDMVHNHYQYSYFQCSLTLGRIDMGAFATRRDIAQQIKLGTSYAADGHFINEFNQRFPDEKRIKIEKVLFIHN